ncbi:MAG TPA: hypothetical protein VK426_01940 [Methanobacterium sp.]|nr:hypothetical protein [Methanobacterium sp.]
MLEFKNFKLENKNNPLLTTIKFNFIDNELNEESMEYIASKLNEYETYLEYDCNSEFLIKYKKKAIIEMILTFPSRKVPEDKKELEIFVNKHVMDFDEYYYKINNFENLFEDNLVEHT